MDERVADRAMIDRVLELIPQQKPFRFIDDIVELTDKHVIGKYTFKPEEFFYEGHFPGNPTTPGVILIEAMAQVSVVAMGIYHELLAEADLDRLTLFTDCDIEFSAVVNPGQTITIRGDIQYYRRGKVRSMAQVMLEDGTLAASGTLAGQGVRKP